ncbi:MULTISPECIES: chloramphenicol resistance leader peptide [Corynebacterium]|nr:chloramphenicol resistance leader peptide [Corynebacterium diphtheriae bv. mitis]
MSGAPGALAVVTRRTIS